MLDETLEAARLRRRVLCKLERHLSTHALSLSLNLAPSVLALALTGLVQRGLVELHNLIGAYKKTPDVYRRTERGEEVASTSALRCLVSNNLFGTDTWAFGSTCPCDVCQHELELRPREDPFAQEGDPQA